MENNLCDNDNQVDKEYAEIKNGNGRFALFQDLREKTEVQTKENGYTWETSLKSCNSKLNRYRDVTAYDHSRIVLNKGDTDYINANLVKVEKANREYILTQGPLENTIGHFWLMVWEYNSKAVIMLNNISENSQVKCHTYWPDRVGSDYKLNLNDIGLTVELLKTEEFLNFAKRHFRITDIESGMSREVTQFHYTTWPDFATPKLQDFLTFLWQVRVSGALDENAGPAVVHCSAGIGRSGTFCLVDSALVIIEKEGTNNLSVSQLLIQMRRYRMGLIQTANQLYFSYEAIIEGIRNLSNPDFKSYEEVPEISYQSETENIAPPLPPPRIASLTGITVIDKKPVPTLPISISAQEFLDFENRNNYVNIEKSSNSDDNNQRQQYDLNIERPLPPIPKDNSLEKVNESDSDYSYNGNENNEYFDSEDDDVCNDNNKEINVDGKHNNTNNVNDIINSINNDIVANENAIIDVDNNDKNQYNSKCNGNKINEKNGEIFNDKSENNFDTKPMISDNIGLKSYPQDLSNNEAIILTRSDEEVIRRRKVRAERRAVIEAKIAAIKRRQKENEEAEMGKPSKKRRCFIFLAASAVVVSVLCAFAYTKYSSNITTTSTNFN